MKRENSVQKGAEDRRMTDEEARACLRGIGLALVAVAGNDAAARDIPAVLEAALVSLESLKRDAKEQG